MTFTVGTQVAWASMAHGSTVEKHGKVVAVVPAGSDPRPFIGGERGIGYSVQFDGITPRNHESYLVEVNTGKDGRGKPKLYWPRAAALEED
jgi:hypothetical protein